GVDQAGRDPAAFAVDDLRRVQRRRISRSAGVDDASVAGGEDAGEHGPPTRRPRGQRRQPRLSPDPIAPHGGPPIGGKTVPPSLLCLDILCPAARLCLDLSRGFRPCPPPTTYGFRPRCWRMAGQSASGSATT